MSEPKDIVDNLRYIARWGATEDKIVDTCIGAASEISRLRAIVEKCNKTGDREVVHDGMEVWCRGDWRWDSLTKTYKPVGPWKSRACMAVDHGGAEPIYEPLDWAEFFSTEQLADAARKATQSKT